MILERFRKGWMSLSQDEKEEFVGTFTMWFLIILCSVIVMLATKVPHILLGGVIVIIFGFVLCGLLVSLSNILKTVYKIFRNGGGRDES